MPEIRFIGHDNMIHDIRVLEQDEFDNLCEGEWIVEYRDEEYLYADSDGEYVAFKIAKRTVIPK